MTMNQEQRFRHLLRQAVVQDPTVHNGLLRIAIGQSIWKEAEGIIGPATQTAIEPDDQFRAESITKMITATTLMYLLEVYGLKLDAGIGDYLSTDILNGLHVLDGRSYGPDITYRHLLSHTSGLPDWFGDGSPNEQGMTPLEARIFDYPDTTLDPREIILWSNQTLAPKFPPGNGWHYSDNNFLVAGLVIEAISGKPLHEVMRSSIFDPLGMEHTYLLACESARFCLMGRSPLHAFVGERDWSIPNGTSAEWAAGALVTTLEDLGRFIRGFVDDQLFTEVETKQRMMTWLPTGEVGVSYGLGIRHFDLEQVGMPGFGELWGHTGFVKSFMFYWPQENATICGTLNQAAAQGVFSTLRPVAAIIPDTLRAIRQSLG